MTLGDKTRKDLEDAFAGESQANRKYLAYAKKADQEGNNQVAKMFRAAAQSETVHAHKHLSFLNGVGSSADNLNVAIKGETYETDNMYPSFRRDAESEGNSEVALYLNYIGRVEKEHADLYQELLDELGNNKGADYYVCGYCGHVHVNEAPEKCPVCGAPKKIFVEIE